MDDENQVGEATLETPQGAEVVEQEQESIDDIKARLAKAEELAKNYKIRAEKAESRTKEEAKPANDGLSAADLIAVAKSGIEAEDLDEVLEYARFKGVPVTEALKSTVIKATLAEKSELRKSAEAANTNAARRGTASTTDEALLANARKGIMPDSDADLARLTRLQMLARRG